MIQSSLAIILYLNCMIRVFGIQETISTSFTESTFSDADGWVVIGAEPQITQCQGKTLFGGYNAFGFQTSVTKTIALPPHYQLTMVLEFCNIDTLEFESFHVYFDQNLQPDLLLVKNQNHLMCGEETVGDKCTILNYTQVHSSPTVVIVLTTSGGKPVSQQSWGIRDVYIYVEKCPDGCLLCKATDYLTIQCLVWSVLYRSWTQLNINQISSDGWNVNLGIAEATQCGSTALFGGYLKTGAGTVISQSFINIPQHDKLKIQFLWMKTDFWQSNQAQMLVDDDLVWQKAFSKGDGYDWLICGNQFKTQFYRVE
ncbi:unnamed protein product, partial (macronuclear) [Paramecium tetraurelia]